MTWAHLGDRGIVRIQGPDAAAFLHNTLTCDVRALAVGEGCGGALLMPQGKILFALHLIRCATDTYLLDVFGDYIQPLTDRLGLYKLRADLEIADASADWRVLQGARADMGKDTADIVIEDPRLAALGRRRYCAASDKDKTAGTLQEYHALRIALGVPEQGHDFTPNERFPHDVALDTLRGIDFKKGCYIGQEVVSRMFHRGAARRRPVVVTGAFDESARDAPVGTAGRTLGTLTSAIGGRGLAVLRLDRVQRARDQGEPIHINGVSVEIALPDWADYTWPMQSASKASPMPS